MNWSYTEDEVRRWYAGKLEEWDWGKVVCAEDMIVAYLAASSAHIDQLFADPDHQGAGLGSALLTAMLERRLRPATLHVFAENEPGDIPAAARLGPVDVALLVAGAVATTVVANSSPPVAP
jgi:GNAT superfamily N-acetyltransferase